MSKSLDVWDQLLQETSRTFALAIPLLPQPGRREVTLAYLLFRVADTLEDAEYWGRDARLRALSQLADLLALPRHRCLAAVRGYVDRWLAVRPCGHSGYLRLLAQLPRLMEELWNLDPSIQRRIRYDAARSARGMAHYVGRGDERGGFQLRSLAELRRYCYCVAGIVGEMLTAIFWNHLGCATDAWAWQATARAYGEGLQLVNILKDSASDTRRGRRYLPKDVSRHQVAQLARRDLLEAETFLRGLRCAAAPAGYLAFAELPLALAHGTLDRVMTAGPGAKLSRQEVRAALARIGLGVRPRS